MKRLFASLSLMLILLLSGCVSQDVRHLQQENELLKSQISRAETKNRQLQNDLKECHALTATLSKEKKAQKTNITSLRGKTREFLKGLHGMFSRFSKNDELMDYTGGELIERAHMEGRDLTIVDFGNPLRGDAVIYMVKGLFSKRTKMKLKLLRRTEDGLLCIWESPLLTVKEKGMKSLDLTPPLNALRGDYLGFYFPEDVGVPYDQKTGDYAVYDGEVKMGEYLPGYAEAKGRNYSMGVAGILTVD
jgi:hypothetical protein